MFNLRFIMLGMTLISAGLLPLSRAADTNTLTLRFTHVVKGETLRLDSLRYQGTAQESFSVSRLSYLLSGFSLQRADGTWLELPDQALWVDLERRRTAGELHGVDAGSYTALRLQIGLPPELNHSDTTAYDPTHPLNPNLNGLHWSWQGGFIFLAWEGLFRSEPSEQTGGFAYHFAGDASRTTVTIALKVEVPKQKTVELIFDLGKLLSIPRPLSFARDGRSTHSRDGDPVALALASNLKMAFQAAPVPNVPVADKNNSPPPKPIDLPDRFTPYGFKLNATFPRPDLPLDNPLTEERVSLGRALFHEQALSRDGSISCASCHNQKKGMADPRQVSLGVEDRPGDRQSMPVFNLAWKSTFFWDGRASSLRSQVLQPIQDHREMDEQLTNVVARLWSSPQYRKLFAAAFRSGLITPENLSLALEQFLLTLTSGDSKFDRALRGELSLSPEEQRGLELFMTENDPRTGQAGADCFHCHGGPLFTDHAFRNNGLDASHTRDPGRGKVTGRAADLGKFVTPTLRNIELTAPYMHDGRFGSLAEVVAHYSDGIKRSETLDPNIAKHPGRGLELPPDDQRALVAFLKTLTDAKLKQEPLESIEAASLVNFNR